MLTDPAGGDVNHAFRRLIFSWCESSATATKWRCPDVITYWEFFC